MTSASSASQSISASIFYKSAPKLSKKYQSVEVPLPGIDVEFPRSLMSIVDGPSDTWKVFQKQQDALNFSKTHGGGLMTFAFQQSNGGRLFLSAHPVYFWFCDSFKKQEDRRTFEIITENSLSKLYLDLEFEKEFNINRDGVRMTNTFIKIMCIFLAAEFNVDCTRANVIDLDSTTEKKFSRHLIFQLPRAYFRDNYNVGNFVKMVCQKLRMLSSSRSDLEEFFKSHSVSVDLVEELFVTDKKGTVKIFCDEGVYTKNRHFRLYKSTKWGKNASLVISPENEYQSVVVAKDKVLPEKQFFLDSLVTYIDKTGHEKVMVLEYSSSTSKSYSVKTTGELPECPLVSDAGENSPYPAIDRFIERYVLPGHIRRSTYFASINRIVYDIAGNRFCLNIGRPHKSNNVLYVVDLVFKTFYQKCHDSDCSGYRSPDQTLPPELAFLLENEGDDCLGCSTQLSDEELQQIWEAVQAASSAAEDPFENNTDDINVGQFPEFGMSDSDILNTTADMMDI